MKDLRPFAQHTNIKEFSLLHNDEVFEREMKVFHDKDLREKKLQK